MSLHPRSRRALPFQVAAVIWLTLVWVGLWGTLTPANVLGGLAIAVLVVRGLPMPPIDYHGRVRVGRVVALVARTSVDLVVASTQVALLALGRRTPRSAVIRVALRSTSDLYLTLTAQLVSLVPGSIVVEAHRLSGTLYVHVLDVTRKDVEEHRRDVLAVEERVLRALASDDELARARLSGPGAVPSPVPAGPDGGRPTDPLTGPERTEETP
ncbi:Na+/H+ antiporter subunit E [Actinotalea sp.]|uniref:Na+/H+ antiporter subunit E n=1 Tax=Actinotalea sp. TaxID=1872145 RepID=UPI003568B05E